MEAGADRMQLPEIARKVNLSPSHFSRLFKSEVRVTPVRYRNSLRLERACHMLETSFMSVKQVMAACGFNDRSYFSREFKKRFGVAPSTYRKKAKD
jgi:transcriptional regulator GlxA family with amidase domain